MMKTNILHVIAGLESHGAETSLSKLVIHMDRSRFENSVVSLTGEGPVLGARLRAEGIPVYSLGYGRGVPNPLIVLPLARLIRKIRPDIIQTWMYHADLAGALAGRLAGNSAVVWGVHNTFLDPSQTKRLTLAVIQLARRVSNWGPQRIVCSSDAACAFHRQLGYPDDKLQVIESGIDTDEFRPDPEARLSVRAELGLAPDTPLVGLSARFHPQKDHATFLQAAGLLHRAMSEVHFVLWGTDVTPDNEDLCRWMGKAGLGNVTHLLGLRRDTSCLTAALDVATLNSSFGESFGLVLGEAMACGVPTVTTDLAGPVSVAGGQGLVVPIKDPNALADAWQALLCLSPCERKTLGRLSRESILERLSLRKTVQEYEMFYAQMMGGVTGCHNTSTIIA